MTIENYISFISLLVNEDSFRLSRLHQIPKLIFSSAKNLIYLNQKERNRDAEHLYICNFLAYHMFHETNHTFDERQLGSMFRHMKILLFFLSIMNLEMLRVSTGINSNLALNMLSLGKAYDNQALHLFSENSIQHVLKITKHPNNNDKNNNNTTIDDYETVTKKTIKRKRENSRTENSMNVNGLMVNRNFGKVSRVGINAVNLDRVLRNVNLQ